MQRYIEPWLTGRAAQESLELRMVRLQAEVAESLLQLRSSVDSLKNTISVYTSDLQVNIISDT